jgi:hypothetical protein
MPVTLPIIQSSYQRTAYSDKQTSLAPGASSSSRPLKVQMGLLALGTPLKWEDASKYADHVRQHGITQLLNIWNRYKSRSGDKLYWGDEVRTSYS